ncbi:MAG: LPS export ABC transporter periplasmic protein LptC [Steroidobacteraceae bacterium]
MRRRSTLITTAIAAALAGYILVSRQAGDELTDVRAPEQPGYYLKQATIIETAADGTPRMKLQAAEIVQNLHDDSISMQQVVLNYRSEDNNPWLLSADQGRLPANSKAIDFSGNVYIRPQDDSQQGTEIRTDTLNIDTENNLATTPGQVEFVMDQQQLTAVGLKYNLKRQTLQLHSQVHGTFKHKPTND